MIHRYRYFNISLHIITYILTPCTFSHCTPPSCGGVWRAAHRLAVAFMPLGGGAPAVGWWASRSTAAPVRVWVRCRVAALRSARGAPAASTKSYRPCRLARDLKQLIWGNYVLNCFPQTHSKQFVHPIWVSRWHILEWTNHIFEPIN